jgi:hypothetical protein
MLEMLRHDVDEDGDVDDDDDDVWGVGNDYSFAIADLARDPTALQPAIDELNRIMNFRMCACGQFIIKDGKATCVYCDMTSATLDPPTEKCAICQDMAQCRHMRRMPCCGNLLHRACLETWQRTAPGICTANDSGAPCPLCRARTPVGMIAGRK